MRTLVEVARSDDIIAAHRVLAILADAGIEAEVSDQYAGTALPYLGAIGIKVVVRAEDAERARAALEEAARAPRAPADDDEEDDEDDDEKGDDGAPPTPEQLEIWAWRTRAIAMIGLAIVIFAVAALFRVTNPPPGIEASPRALRMLRQARIVAWLAIPLSLALLVLLFPSPFGR